MSKSKVSKKVEPQPRRWFRLFEDISPCIVKIETPHGHGTGFYCLTTEGGLTGIATARHVVQHADYWHQPIRIIHESGTIFLNHDERVILLGDPDHDSSIVLFPDLEKRFKFPKVFPHVLPVGDIVNVGVEVAWIGYPAIQRIVNKECFFFGRISTYDEKSYFIDGVAINGVSGGPVAYLHEKGHPVIIGTISAYAPNFSNDPYPYPGLAIAENLSKKPSENSGFHPFCEEKSPDSSTSHPMKNARRTDRLDDP